MRMGDQVELRPASEDDLPMLDQLTQDPGQAGEFQWTGWSDLRRWRRGWNSDGLVGPDGGTLIVSGGGRPLGFVQWRRDPLITAGCSWELSIMLLPEARGHGYGTAAQRLLARYLFAHTTAHRIWATTEVGNVAEHRALEKAGFSREGIIRAAGWRNGAWRDGTVYSLLRTDPAAAG